MKTPETPSFDPSEAPETPSYGSTSLLQRIRMTGGGTAEERRGSLWNVAQPGEVLEVSRGLPDGYRSQQQAIRDGLVGVPEVVQVVPGAERWASSRDSSEYYTQDAARKLSLVARGRS